MTPDETKAMIGKTLMERWEARHGLGAPYLVWAVEVGTPQQIAECPTRRDAASMKLAVDVGLKPGATKDDVSEDDAVHTTVTMGRCEVLIALVHPRHL